MSTAQLKAAGFGRGAIHMRVRRGRLHANITRSKLEERFLARIARARLPRPEVNALVAGHEVDFYWPDHRLIVETDGAATHLTPTAFEDDRRRDAELMALGYRVVRFTWRQVTDHPRATIATLALLLAAAG